MVHGLRAYLAIVAIACLHAWAPARAEETKPVTLMVESVLPITLDSVDPAQHQQITTIRLRLSGGQTPVTLEMIEARQDKRAVNFASAFKFGPAQGTGPDFAVPLEISLARLPFAGKYVAKVRPVQPAGEKAQTAPEIELTFERSSAQLAPLEEFVLVRDAFTGHVEPDKLYIAEQSDVAFANFSFPLVSGQLRGPAGEVLPADILFGANGALGSGQRLALTPVAGGSLPLGTSTGTVRLESPQLAAPVDLRFKVVNRFWIGLLPITIVAFIGLGLLYRKLLADRQELDEGLIEAQRSFARLQDIANSQIEPPLKAGIEDAIASLAASIRQAESAAALRTAASTAGTAVDAILAQATESRRNSRTAIAGLKTALGRPQGHPPEIANVIEDANRQLDEFLQKLDRGFAQSLDPLITGLADDLKDKVSRLVEALVGDIKSDLELVGKWSATEIDGEAGKLGGVMNETDGILQGGLAEIVSASRKVTLSARLFFTRTLRTQTDKVAREVVSILRPAGDEPEFVAVSALQAQIDHMSPLVDRSPPYHQMAMLVRDLAEALTKLLRSQAAANANVEDALAKRDFVAAAKAVITTRPKELHLKSTGHAVAAGAHGMADFLARNVALPADQLPPAPTLRLIAPAQAHVGQTVEVRALIEPPMESAAVSWSVLEGVVGNERREGIRFSFSPRASGPAIIGCEVTSPQSRQVLSAQVSVSVVQSAAERAVFNIRERMTRREWLMSAIVGVFIAGAGTMIFADAFVGSWRDFLFAALWGFTADVGTGRLRALAQPLIARPIPGLGAP
jgi:hypothetical protein